MGNILGNFFGNTTNTSADETMAINILGGAGISSVAYLTAAIESTTPEVRRLLSEYSAQSALAQESISALCVKKGWVNPYDIPSKQLKDVVEQSYSVLSTQ